ncbi:MAG: endonuclease/exonuclease/phosphatase family protein, partial [Candidatus Cryptobacteroides sp.]
PEYSGIGMGRDDGEKGEQTSIIWKRTSLELLEWGCFWLSETPSVPSTGWDAKYPRTATWGLFRHIGDGEVFLLLNTHLDNRGRIAQAQGLELILEKLSGINVYDCPVVITGDFNIPEGTPSLDEFGKFMTDARTNAWTTDKIGSFNAWGDGSRSAIIDYIFYRGFKCCESFQTVTSPFGGRKLVSDHYPICARLIFNR